MAGTPYSLIGGDVYRQAEQVFSPTQTQQQLQSNPLIQELQRMQTAARRQATSAVSRQLAGTGFGTSTFAPALAAQSGFQAASSYLPQIAQTGAQQQQQAVQNFMNLLGLGEQTRQYGQQFGEQQRQFDIGEAFRQKQLDLQRQQFDEQVRQFNEALKQKKRQQEAGLFGSLAKFGLDLIPGVGPLLKGLNFGKQVFSPIQAPAPAGGYFDK